MRKLKKMKPKNTKDVKTYFMGWKINFICNQCGKKIVYLVDEIKGATSRPPGAVTYSMNHYSHGGASL